MKVISYLLFFSLYTQFAMAGIDNKIWFSGANNCSVDKNPAIEVYQYDKQTYILRQNKCHHYEALFMYLLIGENAAILIDTGALKDKVRFPLAKEVNKLIKNTETGLTSKRLYVVHSHSHSDHIAADIQFSSRENTTIVAPELSDIKNKLKLDEWPLGSSDIDIGNRVITFIPTPGHQAESISIYDHKTQNVFTGDNFYPGRLYIRDWHEFESSIARLLHFSKNNPIKYFLGAHIEMSQESGVDYPVGSQYHPNEQYLPLTLNDLMRLMDLLIKNPKIRTKTDKFIIYPLE